MELLEFLNELKNNMPKGYNCIGIRSQYEEFELGEINHLSNKWEDNEITDEELDGICALHLYNDDFDTEIYEKSINRIGIYGGEHIAIIISKYANGGEDTDEIIMGGNPKVVYIVK